MVYKVCTTRANVKNAVAKGQSPDVLRPQKKAPRLKEMWGFFYIGMGKLWTDFEEFKSRELRSLLQTLQAADS